MFGTFALSVGAAVSSFQFCFFESLKLGLCFLLIELGIFDFQVGMEFWARWAHKALWHASLWHMHEVCFLLFTLSNMVQKTGPDRPV